MAKNTVPIIIGAVLFGVLALGLTFYTLLGGSAPTPSPGVQAGNAAAQTGPTSTFYRARRLIYPRTVITRDMLEESEGDAAKIPGAITDPDAVIGHLANDIIQQNQVLTAQMVTTGIGRVIPANIAIPSGLRGVAVWVDPDQTAAGLVDVGDHVDVIATHELKMEKDGNQVIVGAAEVTSGRTIAQNLLVLAVDKSIQQYQPAASPGENGQGAPAAGAPPAPGQPGAPPPGQQPARAPGAESRTRIILAATPEVAQRLVAANEQGKLNLTIRNPGSRDQLPLPEAREYPSRIAAGPPQKAAAPAASSNNANARRDTGRYEPPMMAPSFPAPAPVPPAVIVTGENPTTPPPAPDKDVTVIRGTEKTRVIVPR
jgi:Flp pilus assembly protein CpaB